MSYAAEPYAQFVDDLLMALTGGVTRQEFRFLKELAPFRLTDSDPIIPSTVRVFGISDGKYRRFRPQTDYTLEDDSTIQWNESAGVPAADAVLPDEGTTFYANFEALSERGAAPRLTDRNPGSVTRLLAESFAREFAVMSRQLEAVYYAGFLDTASARDLDQLAVLVGVTRRLVTFAAGTVVFGRDTPSPADIFIPAGTKLSTIQPPPAVFETTQSQTLRRGNLSVEIAVQALASGSSGIVSANTIRVINRPILGIETVTNAQPTRFGGSVENDEALRNRARRALEGAGLATTGALLSALTTIPGLREKDIQIVEDPFAHPGLVKLNVALPLAPDATEDEKLSTVKQAIELIEETRPVGVRILTNIDAPRRVGDASPGSGRFPQEGPPVAIGTATPGGMFMKVDVNLRLAPATLSLTLQQRSDLATRGVKTVNDFIADAGIGEILVYNNLIARLMAIAGVLDVSLEMFPQARPEEPHHKNVVADDPAVRPVAGRINVEVGGALILLDINATVRMNGVGTLVEPSTARAAVADQIAEDLRIRLKTPTFAVLTVDELKGFLSGASANFSVVNLHYNVEYQEAGARIHQQDVRLPLDPLDQLWVRKMSVTIV